MRLHSLEVTAFGPFADRQVVDFDALTQAGLFLLHGPTGAGKSSLLDAVCFALYGRVPGARGVGRLRSDHAVGDIAPLVKCEFTVAGRRLEVTRSPEWQRPKRRGEGTVTERTHVTLREFVDGAWVGLTHRADEAGERLGELIGLGADQFTKLVLLPQGDFAAFLQAHADERKTLLQRLFGTERFSAVETWLADRRRELERGLAADAATTQSFLARAQQALGDEADAAAADTPLPLDEVGSRDADQAATVVHQWSVWAKQRLGAVKESAGQAEQAFERARREHEHRAEQAALRAQYATLTLRREGLREQEAADTQRQTRWDAARSAVVLTPLLAHLRELDDARTGAQQAVAAAQSALSFETRGALTGTDDEDSVRQRVTRLRGELAALGELAVVETELTALDGQQTRCRSDLVMAEQEHQRAEHELTVLINRQTQALADHGAAATLAAMLPDRQEAARRAQDVARAVLEDERLAARALTLETNLRAAIDQHQAAVERALDLRQRRLAGMAAELAAGLAPGQPCPVCGAVGHPQLAEPGAEPVTPQAEQQVELRQRRAEQNRRDAETAVAAIEKRRAAAQALSEGLPAAAAAERLGRAQAEASESAAAQARHTRLTGELAALDGQLQFARSRREFIAKQAADARLELATIGSRIETLQGPVLAARGDDESLSAKEQRLAGEAEALEHVLDVRRAAQAAASRYDAQVEQTTQAARAAGFADVAQAAGAWLDPEEQRALHDRIEAYRAERSAVEAQLADPRFIDASGASPPLDVALSAAALDAARVVAQDAIRLHTLIYKATSDLGVIAQQLRKHAARTKPLRERFAVLDGVAKAAAGAGDNTMRMRLSSYVLAARLEQVAEAASVRLAGMSGGRYTLVHTDGPARSGAKSGLGLAVVDGWSGTQRDPATLSGGETFCTALALALGLADVVQAEQGGAVIETLLVDEGFGSLDADTLDEVMDVLDALRSGGRAVGLVSHVADLRDRIPARLEVVKTRTGSHLVA